MCVWTFFSASTVLLRKERVRFRGYLCASISSLSVLGPFCRRTGRPLSPGPCTTLLGKSGLFDCFCYYRIITCLSLAGNSANRLTWVRQSSRTEERRYPFLSAGFLTCAQMLMHALSVSRGMYGRRKMVFTGSSLWQKNKKERKKEKEKNLPHRDSNPRPYCA